VDFPSRPAVRADADECSYSLHDASARAHAMGGALSFSSDGRGRGSMFRLELPIQGDPR
jgi:hypothetical protein